MPQLPPPYGARAAQRLAVLRKQRTAQRFHALGARALFHAIEEVGPDGWRILEQYVDHLSIEMLRMTGGDRFPSRPLHLVQR